MERFRKFITERTIQASGARGDRHVQRYFNDDVRSKTTYTFASNHGRFKKGDTVSGVGTPIKIGDKHHVMVTADDGSHHHVPISKFVPPTVKKNPEEVEDRQIGDLHKQIQDHLQQHNAHHMDVHLPNGQVIYGVAGVRKVGQPKGEKRKPKADMEFYDKDGKAIHHVSLKAGGHGSQFQQYAGVSEIKDHEPIKYFTSQVRHIYNLNGGRLHHAVQMPLMPSYNREHEHLYKWAKFGPNAVNVPVGHIMYHTDNGKNGIHNVHSVMGGNLTIKSSGMHSGEEGRAPHVHLSADHFDPNHEDNKPKDNDVVLGASHRTGRKHEDLENVRVGIYQQGWRPSAVTVGYSGAYPTK